VKVAVVVNVIAESEVAMCENGSGGQWVCKLKWPCGKVEVVVKVSAESEVATTFHFHTWPLQILQSHRPPLPLSYMATSDYTPTFTSTSRFTDGHFRFYTHFDHHFHFHTWPLEITHPL
jgi:hypothetical protein